MAGNAVNSCTQSSQNECNLNTNKTTPAQDINQSLTSLSSEEQQQRDDEATLRRLLDAVSSLPIDQPLLKFKIAPATYARLSIEIERIVPRHDYFPNRKLLVVRMPSTAHTLFIGFVTRHIHNQLDSTAGRDDDAGRFASEITSGGSARIVLPGGKLKGLTRSLRRQPDEQFQHDDAAFPGVVIEVSCFPYGKELRRLAQDYILYSNGRIKLVIGIDINKEKECTIATWRPKFTTRVNETDILETATDLKRRAFRSSDGEALNVDDCLNIKLSDFAADELTCGEQSIQLHLPFSKLTDFLNRAERIQEKRESHDERGGIEPSQRTLKRRFSSSFEENDNHDNQTRADSERSTSHLAE